MRRRLALFVSLLALSAVLYAQAPVRWLDLDGDAARQTTVSRVPGKYQGHPTTVLLADGKTMLCVHPEGHGKGPIVLQRSSDAGRTWSEPLPVPENWATSQETPTIHRCVDPRTGTERLVLFSGLYPIRSSTSADLGVTWTPLAPIGDYGGIVAMASVTKLANGDYAAFFHDDGRFFHEGGKRSHFTIYQTLSSDGGLTWSAPVTVWSGEDMDLCEPGVVRSPDGKRLAMLLRENSRKKPSQIVFSDDEAKSWSAPRDLPLALCGDRHVGAYAPDGRLLVSFRDVMSGSPTKGDWVAWVGTFADLENGREGQYRVRLSRNWHAWDCGYPGVEVLADGTFVLTTYGHWEAAQTAFVRAVRLRLTELDELAKGPAPTFARDPITVQSLSRPDAWWVKRMEDQLANTRAGGNRIAFLGDSITQGWESNGKEPWQDTWLPRHTVNIGISGDRTEHVLWRLDNGLLEALAAPNNDLRAVVIMIGTNNSGGEDATAEEIALGIEAIVKRLRKGVPNAKILLLAIFPRGERPGPQRTKNARASELAAAAFADDDHVVSADIGSHFVEADGTILKSVMGDFLHLTKPAYRVWSDALLPLVEPLLQ
jgi:lysophospholipase L1-like esterase